MANQEIPALLLKLETAFRGFDWQAADDITRELSALVRSSPERAETRWARQLLGGLRKRRRFDSMRAFAAALPESVAGNAQVRRQLAQSLIEQGRFAAAEDVLRRIVRECPPDDPEVAEARGLLGRSYKQQYVNANADGGPYRSALPYLLRAIDEYAVPFLDDPEKNFWHGINLVACLDRARRDGTPVKRGLNAGKIARRMRSQLEAAEEAGELDAFANATILECLVAQVVMQTPESSEALRLLPARAAAYVTAQYADAFEIGSTLRQLVEVWQLRHDASPGAEVLSVLEAALMAREGGSVQLAPGEARAALQSASAAEEKVKAALQSAPEIDRRVKPGQYPSNLEKNFNGGFLGLRAWKLGMARASGVARIELGGRGIGTAYLVDAAAFFPGAAGPLLLTNAHVVGGKGSPPPRKIEARFEDLPDTVGVEENVYWSSPIEALDTTFLRPKTLPPSASILPVCGDPLDVADPPQFLYIIGYPNGGSQSLSLNDNVYLARTKTLLHYRTPTEPGSSGSPVFDPDTWEVVALHHAGANEMTRLDRSGTYAANEGICVCAIQRQTSKAKVS